MFAATKDVQTSVCECDECDDCDGRNKCNKICKTAEKKRRVRVEGKMIVVVCFGEGGMNVSVVGCLWQHGV